MLCLFMINVLHAQQSLNKQYRSIAYTPLTNIVYEGLINPVKIEVPDVEQDSILVYASKAILNKTKTPGRYNYTLQVPQLENRIEEITITINVKNKGEIQKVGEHTFRVFRVPDPTPLFGSSVSGMISKESISLVKYISVLLEDFPIQGIKFRVTAFNFVYIQKEKGKITELRSDDSKIGSMLTEEMKNVLSEANSSDLVIIKDIYVTGRGIKERLIKNSIVLEVE